MATTRLGQIGVGVDAYGPFVEKQPGAGDRTDELFTRLTLSGIGGAKYAGFLAKAPAEEVPVVVIAISGGRAYPQAELLPPRHYRLRTQTGTFRLRGSPISLTLSLRLSAETGHFGLVGGDIVTAQSYTLSVQPGSFSVIGGDVRLAVTAFDAIRHDNDLLLMAA